MYKFLLVLTVVALTACGSSKTTSDTSADSTAVVTDSVTATSSDSTAK